MLCIGAVNNLPGFFPMGKLVLLSAKLSLEFWIGDPGRGTISFLGENLETYSLWYRAVLTFFNKPAFFAKLLSTWKFIVRRSGNYSKAVIFSIDMSTYCNWNYRKSTFRLNCVCIFLWGYPVQTSDLIAKLWNNIIIYGLALTGYSILYSYVLYILSWPVLS